MTAIKPSLLIHHGNFNFGHDYLRQAVVKRYQKTKKGTGYIYILISHIYPQEVVYESQLKLAESWKIKPFTEQVAFEYPWLLSQILETPLNLNTEK
jgi:hypothetical protein